MPRRRRLTNNSDETDISSLLSADNIFTIPYFQRAYRWKPKRLKQFNDDIRRVIDQNDLHFLGAIIVHGRRSNPSDPDVFDVIDGQQRITTLFLYLTAAVKVLCDLKSVDEAKGLLLKYLVIGRDITHVSNLKLHSCKEDRTQLNTVFKDLLSAPELSHALKGFTIKYLPSTGEAKGTLLRNYRRALRFTREQHEQGGIERLRSVYNAILSNMSVVQIDVSDPTNGPKIFDSLNSRQEPMTIGDLVRNEIFSRIADEEPATLERIDEQDWQPFYKAFQQNGKNLFDDYFFPYGLVQNAGLRKSDVYDALRDKWSGINDPAKIIEALARYQNAFVDICCGTNHQGHKKRIHERFRSLYELKAPSSVYPFLMPLSNAIRDGRVAERDGGEVLRVIESFLVRRAVCGHEPTGLHAVFKRLWADCNGKPTKEIVTKVIRKHRTVVWPTKTAFKGAVEKRPLYGVGITKYLILEHDRHLKGDQPSDVPWIEHVLPETPSKIWLKTFTRSQHETMKDLLANLIPLSERMNKSLSNRAYKEKRKKYLKDSMFKSAREFAQRHRQWTPGALEKRSRELSTWASKRWPY